MFIIVILITQCANTGIFGFRSSDTESTAAEAKQRKLRLRAPKLQFSNVFKKNKDKVTHEDEIAKPMEIEDSKVSEY